MFLIPIIFDDVVIVVVLTVFASLILVSIGARFCMKLYEKKLIPKINAIPVGLDFENGELPSHVRRADAQFYIESSFLKKMPKIGGVILLLLIPLGIIEYVNMEDIWQILYMFFLVSALLMVVNPLFFASTDLIFDRMNGTVTFPYLRFASPATIPFTDIIGSPNFKEGYSMNIQHPCFILNTGMSLKHNIATEEEAEQLVESTYKKVRERQWSFYSAYMDRNRPLPPGEVFDRYRHDDLIRLLKEGLPRPLYWCAPDVHLPHEENSWLRGSELFETCIRRFPVQMLDARKEGMNYCILHSIRMGMFSFIGICGDYFVFDPNREMPEVFDVITESECYGILVNGYHSKVRYMP